MNERIAKLYNQAIIIEDGGDYVCGELDPEKFAELIVQECIDICLRNHIDNIETISAGECAYDIQEHFGVE